MSGEPWQGGIIDDRTAITNNQNYINIDYNSGVGWRWDLCDQGLFC